MIENIQKKFQSKILFVFLGVNNSSVEPKLEDEAFLIIELWSASKFCELDKLVDDLDS